MRVPDVRPYVVIVIQPSDGYTEWWCRACKFGDGYLSGVGRVLDSVDGHVHARHQGDRVVLNIEQPLMTSRVWHFESTPKCRCRKSRVGSRAVCDGCNGIVSAHE